NLAASQTTQWSFNLAHVDDSVNKNILDSLHDECYNAPAVVVHIRRGLVHGRNCGRLKFACKV
ncbi:MAG: hypothetical protein OXI86_03290, partial [Candidatus Poribacteria bacterium]|nr:hypothetical protein [Candidatus Poribacteria bacterium]